MDLYVGNYEYVIYHKRVAGNPALHKGGPWFFKPRGYSSGVYSPGYRTQREAVAACEAWETEQQAEEDVRVEREMGLRYALGN